MENNTSTQTTQAPTASKPSIDNTTAKVAPRSKPRSKIIVLLLLFWLVGVICGSIGAFVLNQVLNTSSNSDSEQSQSSTMTMTTTTTSTSTETAASSSSADCEVQTVAHTGLERFNYAYDGCDWSYATTVPAGDLVMETLHTDTLTAADGGKLTIEYRMSATADGFPECSNQPYAMVGTGGRVQVDGGNWAYVNEIFEKGTQDFSEQIAAFKEDEANFSFCHSSMPTFLTSSTVINEFAYGNPGKPFPVTVEVRYSGSNPALADEVFASMNND